MHSGSSVGPNNPAFSVSIGIAALVIEGRPLFDGEYGPSTDFDDSSFQQSLESLSAIPSVLVPHTPSFTSVFRFNQSDKAPNSPSSPDACYPIPAGSSASHFQTPLRFRSKQDSIEHLQRLRQKLNFCRSTPSTSRDATEQSIALSVESPPPHSFDSDEELEMIYNAQAKPFDSPSPAVIVRPTALQLLAVTSLQTTPRSLREHNGLLKTVESWTGNKFAFDKVRKVSATPPLATFVHSSPASSASSSSATPSSATTAPMLTAAQIGKLKRELAEKAQGKQPGPHCELFLKKIGLVKGSGLSEQLAECDEHYCSQNNHIVSDRDASNDPRPLNLSLPFQCFRWQLHYRQLVSIFAKGGPICIEVYLGPENHAILLEQWTINSIDKGSPKRVTMSLQALCSAIRSQLHFSQITAWSDLLRTASPYDKEFKSNPRIKSASKKAFKPKLDLLYRIRPYDATSCFSATPTEHDFPETMVSEHLAVKISLKSLPRMKAIPQLSEFSKVPSDLSIDESVQPMILDDRPGFPCHEAGKHRCTFDEESPNDDTLSHRDKQLMKYKKRLQRRDRKKRETGPTATTTKATETKTSASLALDASLDSAAAASKANALNAYDQSINPNRPPLYSSAAPSLLADKKSVATLSAASASTMSKATQTAAIEMVSVATQTEHEQAPVEFPQCDFCGTEMQYFCWNCDRRMFNDTIEAQAKVGKAGVLLKSIQRTPSNKQQALYTAEGNGEAQHKSSAGAPDCNSCCKRQKTVHNYSQSGRANGGQKHFDDDTAIRIAAKKELGESSGSYRRTMSESVVGGCHLGDAEISGIANIDLATCDAMNMLSDSELKLYRRAYSEDELICNCDDNRPKQLELSENVCNGNSDKCSRSLGLPSAARAIEHFKTPPQAQRKPSERPLADPIYIKCHSNDDDRSLDAMPAVSAKQLPKINLSKLFSISDGNISDSTGDHVFDAKEKASQAFERSLPVFSMNNVFDFENLSPPLPSPASSSCALVQKSVSAPTFHHSPPTLSPRFLKSAASSKRRSRHLSDRSSERLSIGSDDHLSDEEFHQYCLNPDSEYRPGISPTKASLRLFPKNYAFRKRALLGLYRIEAVAVRTC